MQIQMKPQMQLLMMQISIWMINLKKSYRSAEIFTMKEVSFLIKKVSVMMKKAENSTMKKLKLLRVLTQV